MILVINRAKKDAGACEMNLASLIYAETGDRQKRKGLAFLQVLMELMTGFEPVTSSLPRMRSTD